ncbi:hypothetical protein EPO05_00995 [Patescibacteria group bacterium]|nr:MAG: hypothetical protein EPO05_00995 [Patescibacteria group bacterium]
MVRIFSPVDREVHMTDYEVEHTERGVVYKKVPGPEHEKVVDVCLCVQDAKFVSDEFSAGRRVVNG